MCPENGQPLPVETLVENLRGAFLQAVKVKKNIKHIDYDGPDISNDFGALAVGPNVKDQLDDMTYDIERGRDVLDVLIRVTLQLGMEQGTRIFKSNNKDLLDRDLHEDILAELKKGCKNCRKPRKKLL
jgi:hypothetical protein